MSVTLIVKLDEVTSPESKPAGVLALVLAAKYVHGAAKDDCVTEWGMDLQEPTKYSLSARGQKVYSRREEEGHQSANRGSDVRRAEDEFSIGTNVNLYRPLLAHISPLSEISYTDGSRSVGRRRRRYCSRGRTGRAG